MDIFFGLSKRVKGGEKALLIISCEIMIYHQQNHTLHCFKIFLTLKPVLLFLKLVAEY